MRKVTMSLFTSHDTCPNSLTNYQAYSLTDLAFVTVGYPLMSPHMFVYIASLRGHIVSLHMLHMELE